MIKRKLSVLIMCICLVSISCSTKKKVVDDDFGVEDETGTELTLDDTAEAPATAQQPEKDEFSEFDNSTQQPPAEPPTENVAEAPPPAEAPVETPPAEIPAEPVPTQTAKISDVKFLGNDGGGTLVITADVPLQFKTRMNSNTNQLVVEVQNAILPDRLKRPLNTKDMTSNIGSVDIYQNANSNVARFVVQLRTSAIEPLVQPEGNSLLIVGTPTGVKDAAETAANTADNSVEPEENEAAIMATDNIEDFLANNMKFYGRKISIETTDMDIRDILKFISEESGINMIFDDGVAGKMSLKLRKVPWDQALVTVLKSKRLAYRRQGQVLRIAAAETLAKEEDDAIRLREAKQKIEPLIVRNFSINYAEAATLEAQIRNFISESGSNDAPPPAGDGPAPPPIVSNANTGRGKVTVDARTNSLIVTETAEKIAQVEKLIQILDAQPQQVLIEARVIEASESYSRSIGVNFGMNLEATNTSGLVIPGRDRVVTAIGGDTSRFYSPSATFTPSTGGSPAFTGSLWLGQFGPFGDLSTRLSLDEVEDKVKILSAPRIVVLHSTEAVIEQAAVVNVPTATTTTAAGPVQSTEARNVGVTLRVTPFISSIGTVRLDLNIIRGAVNAAGDITERSIATNTIVKSGETAVVGGVFTSDNANRRSGIPGLKDIPILGSLFRADTVASQKTELIFFIAPKILKTLEAPVFKADSSELNDGVK